MKVFKYRLCKYFYDETTNTFKVSRFQLGGLACNEIYHRFAEGLDEQSKTDHAIMYGRNITDIPEKSCLMLLIEEVLTPFYVFQVSIY